MNSKVKEIKIIYTHKKAYDKEVRVSSSDTAAKVFFANWDTDTLAVRESFYVLLLSNNNQVNSIYCLSKGGITGTVVDIRLLFSIALKTLSVGIILAHNHPSGNKKPSQADITLTNKIVTAGKQLDIKVLDHLILAPDKTYYSFTDNGHL